MVKNAPTQDELFEDDTNSILQTFETNGGDLDQAMLQSSKAEFEQANNLKKRDVSGLVMLGTSDIKSIHTKPLRDANASR